MNLLCPSCQKMLQVPDQYAGQQMRCPMCNSIFTVPSLPESMPMAPPPPPPPPPSPAATPEPPFRLSDAPAPASPVMAQPEPDPTKVRPAPAPRPPVKERDYVSMKSCYLSKRVVPWIAPCAMIVVFLLTFFPWYSPVVVTPRGAVSVSASAWTLAFGSDSRGIPSNAALTFYVLLTLFGTIAMIVDLLMHLRIIPAPPPLDRFRAIIFGGFVWLAFLILFLNVLIELFDMGMIWLNVAGLLAYWTHLIASVALALEAWLQLRGPEAPSPRFDLHL